MHVQLGVVEQGRVAAVLHLQLQHLFLDVRWQDGAGQAQAAVVLVEVEEVGAVAARDEERHPPEDPVVLVRGVDGGQQAPHPSAVGHCDGVVAVAGVVDDGRVVVVVQDLHGDVGQVVEERHLRVLHLDHEAVLLALFAVEHRPGLQHPRAGLDGEELVVADAGYDAEAHLTVLRTVRVDGGDVAHPRACLLPLQDVTVEQGPATGTCTQRQRFARKSPNRTAE